MNIKHYSDFRTVRLAKEKLLLLQNNWNFSLSLSLFCCSLELFCCFFYFITGHIQTVKKWEKAQQSLVQILLLSGDGPVYTLF